MTDINSPITTTQIIIIVLSYLIGAIPFGVIVSRLVSGKDVRQQGSGNTGATNVARMMGKKWGILVLALDALKGYVVVEIASHFGDITLVNVVAAIAVIGHCYPIYLNFKGGKGVATALGVIAAMSPMILGLAFVIFGLVVVTTRIISAASLAAALSLPILATAFSYSQISHQDLFAQTAWVITLIVWWKHRENIRRLVRRQEPKFF